MTFSKVDSMTKTRTDKEEEETRLLLITDGDQRSPCAFSDPQMGAGGPDPQCLVL